ncbi:hypothetical protein DPMN_193461 [Dreissena polymorpha]|uniref:Uncharacterized protein n=1 Tax=Dreissena polymorpha TaxID=45954 RepID=A0A9D3Y024_DREPO|nr:hypothetical protein DPMN_193461 [Dreissena polymorpha]
MNSQWYKYHQQQFSSCTQCHDTVDGSMLCKRNTDTILRGTVEFIKCEFHK